MTRLLLATLLCALGTTQASAQNVVSQGLLDLDDDVRNASFTLILKESDRRCDQVAARTWLEMGVAQSR